MNDFFQDQDKMRRDIQLVALAGSVSAQGYILWVYSDLPRWIFRFLFWGSLVLLLFPIWFPCWVLAKVLSKIFGFNVTDRKELEEEVGKAAMNYLFTLSEDFKHAD